MQAAPGAAILCGARGGNDHRNRFEFFGHEPDTRALLVRGNQWCGGGSADGDVDDHVRERSHRERIFTPHAFAGNWLDRDDGDAAGVAGIYSEWNPWIVLTPV
jgi:hypothetical protein